MTLGFPKDWKKTFFLKKSEARELVESFESNADESKLKRICYNLDF